MPRLAPALLLLIAPACTTPEVTIPPQGGERGIISITTWADGAVAGGLGVYLHDDAGEVRGHFVSDDDGQLEVEIADGWSATVIDELDGFAYVDTVLALAPGDVVAIGQRRAISGDAPALRIAPLTPLDAAARYTVTVCGPVATTSPVRDPAGETVAQYDRRALDEAGGALIVAEATFGDQTRFALVDADDVAALADPVVLPAWREPTTTAIHVEAIAEALELSVSLRSHHGCVVGSGAGRGPEVPVLHYPGLPIEVAAAYTWLERGDRNTSWTARRVAVQTDPFDSASLRSALAQGNRSMAPTALLAEVPARVDQVAVQAYGSGTVLGWQEAGDPLAGDGVIIVAAPSYDSQWTLVAPRGRKSVILPRLSEVPDGAPQWVNVSIVELDEVDGWAELSSRAGVPRWDEPGWSATGTVSNPVD